jgi:hypothetical protein
MVTQRRFRADGNTRAIRAWRGVELINIGAGIPKSEAQQAVTFRGILQWRRYMALHFLPSPIQILINYIWIVGLGMMVAEGLVG